MPEAIQFVSALCKIPANPDISGVGVRTAIYIQNLLSLLSALWALWDGKVTQNELEHAEMQTTTNLILAFAILISSFVQANTLGMTNYHANIVLSMSWMNNTNAFVYFILYIHHKIGLQESEGGVGTAWRAWVKHVKDSFSFTLRSPNVGDTEAGTATSNDTISPDRKGAKILVKRFVLVLGSLHLTVMAALGVWLWSNLEVFGLGNRKPADFRAANECAVNTASIAILGRGVPIASSTLRALSIAIYSLFLIPVINLIAPMILFLATYIGCQRIPFAKRWSMLPAYIGLGILLAINVILIVDIELTRAFNHGIQGEDEADWGFGQILAILLLLLPLRDLLEAVLARRLKQRQGELHEDLQEAINSQAFDRVERAIRRGSAFPSPKSPDQHSKFWSIISAHGALEYFDNLRRARMTITELALEGELHLAIKARNRSRITTAYNQGADLIAGVLRLSTEAADMVFWYAISSGYHQIVKYHAQRLVQRINEQGPDGKSALIIASEKGHELLIRFLLEIPLIDVNLQDPSGRTALIAAAENGCEATTRILLERADIKPNAADKHGQTALIWASLEGHESIAKMLLDRPDIQPNATDKYGRTPLIHASQWDRNGIVEMLLDRPDTQPNAANKDNWTALTWASARGNGGIVKALLKRPDIRPDTTGTDGTTPLISASCWGHEAVVQLLLDRPDVQLNAADKDGDTPLICASKRGYEGIVKVLLNQSGIQLDATKDGNTADEIASEQGHHTIAAMILSKRSGQA